MPYSIHHLAEVQTENIGNGSCIWQYSVVLEGASIGKNCNINCHTFIENDVIIGDNVTVKSGVYLWDGLRIEDNVFIGPAVVFTNDIRPRSRQQRGFVNTIIRKGASLGANSTILAGVTVGEYAMTGIGSNVTQNVPDFALVYGNPARVQGWVDEGGSKLDLNIGEKWTSLIGKTYLMNKNGLQEVQS